MRVSNKKGQIDDILSIVDLGRYPIHALESAEGPS